MAEVSEYTKSDVHCRIGSLEKPAERPQFGTVVHCRIGSLERLITRTRRQQMVHCRAGSSSTGLHYYVTDLR